MQLTHFAQGNLGSPGPLIVLQKLITLCTVRHVQYNITDKRARELELKIALGVFLMHFAPRELLYSRSRSSLSSCSSAVAVHLLAGGN
jgi:hypothetical protein